MSLEIAVNGKWDAYYIQDFKVLREQRIANNGKIIPHIERLFATGDELEFIRENFSNIPTRRGNLNIWRGDMAKFIFENL